MKPTQTKSERVQKLIALVTRYSRREAEKLIEEGSVTINGKKAKLGAKATVDDAIKVNGKLLQLKNQNKVYYAFYKPRSVIAMVGDAENRPNLRNYLKSVKHRVFPVGRMDFSGEGLLLLTNDGDYPAQINKNSALRRVYRVKVKGHPDATSIEKLKKGGRLNNTLLRPQKVRVIKRYASKSLIELTFIGSGSLPVSKLLQNKGFLVEKIIRYQMGGVHLRGLSPGELCKLTEKQAQSVLT